MDEHFLCEDCGHEFPKTSLMPDVEDADVVACPECGGMDIQLVVPEKAAT